MIRGAFAAAVLAGTAVCAGPANATEVKVPKGKPRVEIDVPDGWSVEETDIGIKLRSPEKDSVVFATILKHDLAAVEAWKKKVLERMGADGVTAEKSAEFPAAPVASAAAPAASAAAPAPSAAAPAAASAPKPVADGSPSADASPGPDLPGTATIPSFALTGPTAGMPADPVATPSSEAPASRHDSTIHGLHFQSFRLEGGKFKGQPTDLQLVIYKLPKGEFFVVEQQSSSEDNRAAVILNSVTPLKP